MKRLQNLSYKTLFTILFLGLAGIVFLLKIGGKTQKVSAAWWNDSWHQRQAISISNPSGSELIDFQVAISIGTSQLIADGKMQSDCDDIRITDINGTELPYWIEENNPGCNQITDTKIWIKANSIPTSGSTIYIYYGNSSAEAVSDVTTTFGPLQKLSLGASYTVTPSPSGSYSDNGGTQLTNGLVRENLYQSTEATVGWQWQNPITATINLNKISVISSFKLYLGGGGAGGINIPSQITTSYSLDNSNYNSIGVGGSWTNSEQWVTINNNSLVAARYGKSAITTPNEWTMVGEIEIYGYPGSSIQANTSYVIQSEETNNNHPIAYWKFDESSGATAYDSVNSNNGTITAATHTPEDQCISGKCLYFNGTSSSVSIPHNVTLKPKNYISMSAWIKPTDITTNTYYDIYRKEDGDDRQLFSFQANGTVLSFGISTGGSYQELDVSINPSDFTDGNWHFVSAVYDGQHKYIYKDGKPIGSQLATGTIGTSGTANAYIGSSSGSSEWFKGYIDDFKIYSYPRTPNQILQDYNSHGSISGSSVNLGVQSNISSLVAYYKFEEGVGTTAYDSSVNGNNGILINSPTWTKSGKINKALSFDGVNDYVTIPRSVQDDFSISFWVKTTAAGGTGAWYNGKGLVDGEMGGYVNDFGVVLSGSKLGFGTGGSDSTLVSNQSINNGVWRHIVVTRKKSTGQKIIYIDGSLDISGTAGTNSLTSSTDLKIGAIRTLTGSGYLNGLIDEVKIYNKVLTANEVEQEYNIGSAVQFGSSNQTIGGTTTSLNYCIPGDTSYCASPVAEWNMDQDIGTSIIDTSSNDNDGTPGTGSAAPSWIQGKIGKALSFNGGQYVTVNDNTSLKPANAITVESWFYSTNKSTSDQRILSKTESSGYQLSLNENSVCPNNTLCFLININGTYRYATYPVSSLSNNTWYHVAGTYDGSIVKLFLNGSNIGTSASASNIIKQSTYKVCIGSEVNSSGCSGGGFFYGKIDQLKIYDYARTPAQIAYDYNRGGPVGWWKMDECQGSTVYDWSGNGNNGTLTIGSNGTQNSVGTCQIGTSAAWTNGATGKFNSSLNFDGTDDYVNLGNATNIDITRATSISAWIYPKSLSGEKTIYRKEGQIAFNIIPPNLDLWLYNGSWSNVVSFDGGFSTSNWYHVVATWDGNYPKLYINGLLKATGAQYSSTLRSSSYPSYIGVWTDGSTWNSYWNGQIDDVHLYNYALTPEQIKQIYNGGAINFN